MKIAFGSDMQSHLTTVILNELKDMGHEVIPYGAICSDENNWSKIGIDVAQSLSNGEVDQAILSCWTGTGICMAANKVPHIRAALCRDAETAKGARTWNDANILVLSLRAMSEEITKETLQAWFNTAVSDDPQDVKSIEYLKSFDQPANTTD